MFESNQEEKPREKDLNDGENENMTKPNPDSFDGAEEMEQGGEVHTMPEKFLSPDQQKPAQKKSGGKKNLIIIIAIVVVVVGGLLGAAIYLFQRVMNPEPSNTNMVSNANEQVNDNDNANRSTNQNANDNENDNDNDNVNENSNDNQNSNANDNANLNTNDNENSNTNTNTNSNSNSNSNLNVNAPPADSEDTDDDELTDVEEEIYNTSPSKPDTDQDGYLDGEEVLAGYDPKDSGAIEDSEAVDSYVNSTYAYSILYPSSWLEDTVSSGKEVWFTSTTGEFIEVLVESNPGELDAKEWYLNQMTEENIDPDDLEEVRVGDLLGVKSLDGLSVYFAEDDFIYGVIYNIGTKNEINFRTTYTMVYKSLKTGVTVLDDTNTNTNSNVNSNSNANTNDNENANLNDNTNS